MNRQLLCVNTRGKTLGVFFSLDLLSVKLDIPANCQFGATPFLENVPKPLLLCVLFQVIWVRLQLQRKNLTNRFCGTAFEARNHLHLYINARPVLPQTRNYKKGTNTQQGENSTTSAARLIYRNSQSPLRHYREADASLSRSARN